MKNSIGKILEYAPVWPAWRRVLHLWKPMAIWTILIWILIAIILAPVSSAILGLQFFRRGHLVIGNEELISWLFSPVGASYILLAGSLMLAGWTLQFAGLFQIITEDLYGREINLKTLLTRIIGRIPRLFRLCLFIVAAGLVSALPLAAGLGLIYELFLDTYDINYYLSQTPLEWHIALLSAIIWICIWGLALCYLVARSLLALPVYLNGHKSIRESISYAWEIDKALSKQYLQTITIIIVFWIFLRITADTLIFFISAEFVSWIDYQFQSLRLIALASAVYIAGTFIIDAIITFLGFSHVSAIITQLFYRDLEVSKKAPPSQIKFKKITAYAKSILRPVNFLSLIAFMFVASMLVSGYMIEQVPHSNPSTEIKIAAHRAGPPPAPENTLQALDSTLKTGADYAEIDVQLTRDSIIIVTHDLDLMRKAGSSIRIANTSYKQIQEILAAEHGTNPQIPKTINTLTEFLDATRGRIELLVELKQSGEALTQHVVSEIKEKEMENEVVLMSMNAEHVARIRSAAPKIAVGYVSAYALGNLTQLPVELLALNYRVVNENLLSAAKQQNMKVYAWTVNKTSVMAEMIEMGIDGIITDHPKIAVQVREEIQQLTTAERLVLRFQNFVLNSK